MSVIAGVGGELLCFLGEGKVQKLAGVDIKLLSLFSHLSCIDWLLEYLVASSSEVKTELKYFVHIWKLSFYLFLAENFKDSLIDAR